MIWPGSSGRPGILTLVSPSLRKWFRNHFTTPPSIGRPDTQVSLFSIKGTRISSYKFLVTISPHRECVTDSKPLNLTWRIFSQKRKRISVRLQLRLSTAAAAVLIIIKSVAAAFKSGHLHSKIMKKQMVSIRKMIISDAIDSLRTLNSDEPGN